MTSDLIFVKRGMVEAEFERHTNRCLDVQRGVPPRSWHEDHVTISLHALEKLAFPL